MCLYQLPALLVQCPKVFVWLLVLYLNLYLQSICISFSCVFYFVAFHVYCILSTPCTALLVQCRRSGIPQTKGWDCICVMHVFAKYLFSFRGHYYWRRMLKTALLPQEALVLRICVDLDFGSNQLWNKSQAGLYLYSISFSIAFISSLEWFHICICKYGLYLYESLPSNLFVISSFSTVGQPVKFSF